MSVAFMRPIRETDFEAVHALAEKSGGGMTNLPSDRAALRARIYHAVESFGKDAKTPGGEVYTIVLEKDGAVLGLSAVFSAIGLQSGFVNYRINREFYSSAELGKRIVRRVLIPTHDFTGASEVGSLFLSPDARGGGFGKLLSRARYMFIAQRPEAIAERVCAELRGWRAPDGGQPFWNAVGRHFFEMDFEEADAHNSAHGNQFIEDMMPRYPIYAALLPEDARACLGRPHDNALPAYKMLLAEGFAYNGYIDIFDGGPLVDTKISNIRTIRESRLAKVAYIADKMEGEMALLAAGEIATFRACKAPARIDGGEVTIDRETAAALNVEKGGEVRWAKW